MAVLDLIPDIEVTISVDKTTLAEYPDKEAEQAGNRLRTVSKYIESITDARFCVEYLIKPQYEPDSPSLVFELFVDGLRASSRLVQTEKLNSRVPYSTSVEGVGKTDGWGKFAIKPFRFSKIVTSSDEKVRAAIEVEAKSMSKVGEIIVEIHRKSKAIPRAPSEKDKNLSAPAEVHEKAMKGDAKSHGVSLGPGIPTRPHHRSATRYLDSKRSPLATYRFKYRSENALKQLLIIERTPNPDAAPNRSALDDLDPEKRREAERYIEQLKKGNGVKRERGEVEASRKKVCKSEEEIMMVDLTGDD